MKESNHPKSSVSFEIVNWILLISCALIWGCSYYLIKQGLKGFEPIQIVSIRIVAAAFALLPFLYSAIKNIPKSKYPYVLACAVLGNGIPIYLYPVAQTHISSSVAGIINSLTPLFTYIIAVLFYSMKYSRVKLAGVLVGLLGVICLILLKPQASFHADIFYALVALSAPMLYGVNNNIRKNYLADLPGIQLTSLMYFMILIPSIPLLFISGVPEQIQASEASREALPYIIALGVFGTAVAISLSNILYGRVDIMFATSVTYLMPVVALFLGLLDNERIGWYEWMGLALILGGVIIITRSRR